MFIVNGYPLAVVLCFVTMLCWGSWGNTQKLAGKTWRYELFYWDYVLGMVIWTLVMGFTLGSFGAEGRSFVTDLGQASWKALGLAFAGGVVFNASNILLSASTSIAGMSVAFPLGVGLALVFGVFNNYFFVQAKGNPVILFIGVALVVVAIVCNGIASGRMNRGGDKSSQNRKGILLALLAGILMSFFSPLVLKSVDLTDFANPEAGLMTPYSALFILSIGVFVSNILFNTLCMRKPFVGEPVSYRTYFGGGLKIHLVGMLGGAIWCLGTALNYIAAGKAGAAVSYALGQGAPMIAAIWGVFVWKEFKGSDRRTAALLAVMFVLFIAGLGMVVAAGSDSPSSEVEQEEVNIIFETDMGNDIDDVLALDMLFKYADAGKVNLLGIGINKECGDGRPWPAEFVDVMRTWYGYEGVPVGFIRRGAQCDDYVNYAEAVCGMKDEDGGPLFARSIDDYDALPEVPALYRTLLASRPDNSVTMVSVGFSTNLAALLDSPADDISPLTGEELVVAKVRLLSLMGGRMDDSGYHEYNIVKDIPAAQKVFSDWPTLIVVSPFELGSAIRFPAESIENGFGWVRGAHPAVEAYKAYRPMPYSQKVWDLTSVLYAVEGPSRFTVSPLGNIEVDEEGGTVFTEAEDGNRQFLSVTETQAQNILARLVELVTAEPKRFKE